MNAYRITRVTVAAESLALVTVDQAKAVLGIDLADTSQDAALQAQIDSVSAAVNNHCDRIFAVQSYRDQIRSACGRWGEPLVVRQYPIVLDDLGLPVVTVAEDGSALDPAFMEAYPETGSLYRLDSGSTAPSAWTAALITVDYTAGFAAIPADVQAACLEWLTARYRSLGRDPTVRSVSIPDVITEIYGSVGGGDSSTASSLPSGVRDLLEPYRIWSA